MIPERFFHENIKSLSTSGLIKVAGGFVDGHVIFETGEHGNGYVDNLKFLRHPAIMTEMGNRLAQQFSNKKDQIDCVVGPSIIGAIIAYAVALNFDVPFTTTYRAYGSGEMNFHRGYVPERGTKCLFVDDFVFSGKCLNDNIKYMENLGLDVQGASVIGVRSGINLNGDIRALIQIPYLKTTALSCGLCTTNVPILANLIRE